MPSRCIIVEDEPLALKRMQSYVSKVASLQLVDTFSDGLSAFDFLQNHSVDLIFLDVEMDQLTGGELLQIISPLPPVILTTAFEKYALQSYEWNVVDFLLKPFSFERFLKAVQKFQEQQHKTSAEKDYIFIKTEHRIEKVRYADILYIEGMSDYRNIQTPNKKILTLETFGALEKRLPPERFCRVHKSYLVAIDAIEFVERHRIKIGTQRIPISDTYRRSFYDRIGFKWGK